MDIFRLVSFALAAVMLLKLVTQHGDKGHSVAVRIFVTALLLALIIPELKHIFDIIRNLAERMQLKDTYLLIVFKIIGVAYLAEFGYQLCKDAGEDSIGNSIQLAGKVMILILATPIALALIELVTNLL